MVGLNKNLVMQICFEVAKEQHDLREEADDVLFKIFTKKTSQIAEELDKHEGDEEPLLQLEIDDADGEGEEEEE